MKNFFGRMLTVFMGNIFTLVVIGICLFLFIGIISMFGSFGNEDKKLVSNSVLEINLSDPVMESNMETRTDIFSLGEETNHFFLDYLRAIEAAKTDDKIKGISLKLNSFKGGLTQLQDFRKALLDFKESGKFIYAYGEELSQGAYFLSTVADSIFQHPMGGTELKGLNMEVTYYKNLGDKYGIDFQVIRHGDFKSAVEPFLRDDMSEENRLQLSQILNQVWGEFSNQISESRNISNQELNVLTDSLTAFIAQDALKNKLIDVITHEEEYDRFIADKINLELNEDDDGDFYTAFKKQNYNLTDYLDKQKNKSKKEKVAILYAAGEINNGDGFEGIQSETYVKAIRKLRNNEKVKAVVFRINSGGGSAFASDEILQEMKYLKQEKPVIVSFGDVAASGGYYIAMESDSIFAQPTTITGSIGVLGMIPNFKKLANNNGITTDVVKTNANSEILSSSFQPLNDYSKSRVTDMIENIYNRFVNHVSEGRDMTFEEVDSIGGGRVWTGADAKKIGLIDAFGNLNDAIKAAAAKANLEEGDYSITNYPFKKQGIEQILEQYQVGTSSALIKQELGTDYYEMYQELKQLKEGSRIRMKLPYSINIQ